MGCQCKKKGHVFCGFVELRLLGTHMHDNICDQWFGGMTRFCQYPLGVVIYN